MDVKGQYYCRFFQPNHLSEEKEAPGPYGPTHTYDVDDLQYMDSNDFMLLPILTLAIVLCDQVFRECYLSEVTGLGE